MKALQTKKFLGKKSISDAAIPVQSQIKSRPFVTNSAPQSQELTQKPEEAKQQGFNFAQIPIFPGMRPAMPEMLQPKQAEDTLKHLPEVNLAPSGSGQPMPKLVQQKMETSFDTDFSDVRIHEGSQAEKIGALAYTQGKNIHFRPGKYQPNTQSGQELLGHELAHVQQQRAGRVTAPQSKGVTINTDSQLETEADVMGAKAARGESAQVNGAANSEVQRMPAQVDVVQCMPKGKEPERSQDNGEAVSGGEDEFNIDELDKLLEEVSNFLLNTEMGNAKPQELAEIAGENSLLAPVAAQMLISSGGQEQAGSSTNTSRLSQNRGNRQINSQDVQQEEEDNRPLAEIFASIENILLELESELPPESELKNQAATTRQELSQGSAPRIPLLTSQRASSNRPQKPKIPPEIIERLVPMDETTRNRRLAELSQRFEQPLIESIREELRERDRQQQPPPIPVTPQQQDQQIHPPVPTRQPPPIPVTPQQRPRPPVPITPVTAQQEAQRLLTMNNTTRAQRIAQLRQQGIGQRVIEDIIERFDKLSDEQDEIARLEGRIPPQGPQQEQPTATRWKRTKARIDKPFGNTKESRKEVADTIKQNETYADQTKILGQDSSQSNVDQVLGQNLPANDANPNSYVNLPPGETEKFGNDAAIIGMTRDDVKAVGGLLLFHDSLRKFKSAFRDKTKPKKERIANASDGLGNMTSAVTYTGIVGTQARKGAEHHQAPGGSTSGSGALAAVKQGGTIAGTSIPFDAGKAAASVLTTVPKLIMYTDAGLKATQRENFGGGKSMGRGVKNVADLTKSAAGAVKDVSSLAYSIEQSSGASSAVLAGAEGAKIIAGGAVAPAAATVFGTAEAIQGGYKFNKAYQNKKGLAEIGNSPTLDQLETIDQLKEIQKKKMKRAAINTVLGNVTLAAGVVGFSAGPAGLVAATAMGASVGAFQIGQWGTRKLKQKMRDKGVKGFDPNKTTERKNEARKELTGNTLTMLEGAITKEEKQTIFSSMGLNGNKKDIAVQEVYNNVLAKYLSPQELQQPTTAVNRILKLKGDKNNLKQEVSWDQLSSNDFPADFARQVKKAAIDKALKKR